jgi:hypothetical protein
VTLTESQDAWGVGHCEKEVAKGVSSASPGRAVRLRESLREQIGASLHEADKLFLGG